MRSWPAEIKMLIILCSSSFFILHFCKSYFLYNNSGRLLLNLYTVFIGSTLSCLPYLYKGTRKERRGDQFRITCSIYLWLTMHWQSRSMLMQSNIILADKYLNSALKLCQTKKDNFRTLSSYFWLNVTNLLTQFWEIFIFLSWS